MGSEKRLHTGILTLGGKEYRIRVADKVYLFEDHRYCGPVALRKDTKEALRCQPKKFLRAASLWAQQGRKVSRFGFALWKDQP